MENSRPPYSKELIPDALKKLSCDGFVVFSPDFSGFFHAFKMGERFDYQQISGMSQLTCGSLFEGNIGGKHLLCIESCSDQTELENLRTSVIPVHIAKQLGLQRGIIFGSAKPSPAVEAEIGLITDQINLTGLNPLIGPNDNTLGVRFPDMTRVFDPGIQAALEETVKESHLLPQRGVLVGMPPDQQSLVDKQMDSLEKSEPYFLASHLVAEAIVMRHAGRTVGGMVVLQEINQEKLSHLIKKGVHKIF